MIRRTFFLGACLIFIMLPFKSATAYLIDSQKSSMTEFHGLSSQSSKNSIARKFYKDGIEFLSKNKFAKAQEAFEQSLKKDPKYVNSILGLAEVHFKKGQISQAGQILNDALKHIGEDDDLYLALGRYLYLEKKFDQSESAFKKAIAINLLSVKARLDLGDLYLNALNKTSAAVKVYRDVINLNPDHAGAHYALGMALSNLGQEPENVVAEFQQAMRLEPTNPLPFNALAQVYIKQNDLPKALDVLTKVIKIYPKFIQAYIQQGDIYLNLNQTDKALDAYTHASAIDPKFVPIYTKIGMVHQVRKEGNEAIKFYKKAIQMDPNQPFAQNNLAWVLLERKGNLQEALIAAQKAVDLAPGVPEFLDTLAKVKEAQGH